MLICAALCTDRRTSSTPPTSASADAAATHHADTSTHAAHGMEIRQPVGFNLTSSECVTLDGRPNTARELELGRAEVI